MRRASIGAGGVAATPARARQTEAALTGQPWTADTIARAAQALQAEFSGPRCQAARDGQDDLLRAHGRTAATTTACLASPLPSPLPSALALHTSRSVLVTRPTI